MNITHLTSIGKTSCGLVDLLVSDLDKYMSKTTPCGRFWVVFQLFFLGKGIVTIKRIKNLLKKDIEKCRSIQQKYPNLITALKIHDVVAPSFEKKTALLPFQESALKSKDSIPIIDLTRNPKAIVPKKVAFKEVIEEKLDVIPILDLTGNPEAVVPKKVISEEVIEEKSKDVLDLTEQPDEPIYSPDPFAREYFDKHPENLTSIPENAEENLVRLKGSTWLSNTDQGQYLKFLKKAYPEIYTTLLPLAYTITGNELGIGSIKEGLLEGIENMLPGQHIMGIPLLVSENHYTLVLFDRKNRTLEYYDSKKNYGNHDVVVKTLENLIPLLNEKDPGEKPYHFKKPITKCLQKDGYECTIWTLYFLTQRVKNPNVVFNEQDIPKIPGFRNYVITAIHHHRSQLRAKKRDI